MSNTIKKKHYNCKCTFLLTIFFLITFFLSSFVSFSQRTHIPDANFREVLSNKYHISADSDNTILTSDAVAVSTLNIVNRDIRNLSGIEAFITLETLHFGHNSLSTLNLSKNIALRYLNCRENQLTSLDISKNTALRYLNCNRNQLTSLNVSKSTALTTLYCDNNLLSTLDVSENTILTELRCSINQLTSLDVSENTILTELRCSINPLTTIDVSKNTALTFLSCAGNQLMTIDVSKNTALTFLHCGINQLMSLDVSKNTALTFLGCDENRLTELDISINTALTRLYCKDNQLTRLNIQNGNNHNFRFNSHLIYISEEYHPIASSFLSTGNLDLRCIQVDNTSYSTTNWPNKDATAVYSENCFAPTIIGTAVDIIGKTITMQTSEPVILTNVNNEDFTVTSTLNGITTNHQVASIVIVSGSIILTVTLAIPSGATISISYDPQGSSMEAITNSKGSSMSPTDITLISNDYFEIARFSVFPNPTRYILNITTVEKADYTLLNIRGQILKKGVLSTGKSKINISSLSKGIYLLNVKTGKSNFTERVVKN